MKDRKRGTMTKAVFIVDDHTVMRKMLRDYLELSPDLSVVGVASSAETALEALPEMEVDLVLVDVSLPQMSGIDMAAEVAKRWPKLPCLMFSAHEEATYARRALAAGARGYVVKGNPKELVSAIRQVLDGKSYISAPLRKKVPSRPKDRK